MAFEIDFTQEALEELENLSVHESRLVYDTVIQQLRFEPNIRTRNRKPLEGEPPANFIYLPPLWELRVGSIRVFYTIDEAGHVVVVHAIRDKTGKTTDEVLNETDQD